MSLTKAESAFRAWTSRLRSAFGMSVDDYYGIRELQGGQCPICGRDVPDPAVPGESRRFPVDHDHKSGEVRGIPCPYCNKYRIGRWTSADIGMLEAVLSYLRDPPARRHFGSALIVPGHGKRKRRAKPKPVS